MTEDGPLEGLPDVRDGLTRRERIVLWVLSELEKEHKGRVPVAQLYGHVLEKIDLSVDELQSVLTKLGAATRTR